MQHSTHIERVAPNPFRPAVGSCSITIVLVYPGETQLKIFSVDGREVATLLSRELGIGKYSVAWDGRSSDGTEAPSGTYLCRLTSGVVVRTENVVLTR